jgi:hypothetical protein
MGYRARLELPTPEAYGEIFRRAVIARGLSAEDSVVNHLLKKYDRGNRPMKCCEPRDLLNRVSDLCMLEGQPLQVSESLIDIAWENYFGKGHSYKQYSAVSKVQAQAAVI